MVPLGMRKTMRVDISPPPVQENKTLVGVWGTIVSVSHDPRSSGYKPLGVAVVSVWFVRDPIGKYCFVKKRGGKKKKMSWVLKQKNLVPQVIMAASFWIHMNIHPRGTVAISPLSLHSYIVYENVSINCGFEGTRRNPHHPVYPANFGALNMRTRCGVHFERRKRMIMRLLSRLKSHRINFSV